MTEQSQTQLDAACYTSVQSLSAVMYSALVQPNPQCSFYFHIQLPASKTPSQCFHVYTLWTLFWKNSVQKYSFNLVAGLKHMHLMWMYIPIPRAQNI